MQPVINMLTAYSAQIVRGITGNTSPGRLTVPAHPCQREALRTRDLRTLPRVKGRVREKAESQKVENAW